jgi:hypothetical protein
MMKRRKKFGSSKIYLRPKAHEDATAKMLQDESAASVFKQFESLITQEKSMVTGEFSRLKV